MEILSATLLLWSGYEGSYYSADPTGQSWVRMWVSWAWQGVPGGYWTDRFVYLWSHDFTLDRAQVASYADTLFLRGVQGRIGIQQSLIYLCVKRSMASGVGHLMEQLGFGFMIMDLRILSMQWHHMLIDLL